MGELLITWSARVVVAFYLLRLAADVLIADPARRDQWARWAWTVGCAVFLAHVVFAFHFFSHGGAERAAVERAVLIVGVALASDSTVAGEMLVTSAT